MEGAEDRGEPVSPTVFKRMKGQAVNMTRDLKTQMHWDQAVLAARSAGEQGLWDLAQGVPVQRKSQFRSKADEEREIYGGERGERLSAESDAREEARRLREQEREEARVRNEAIWAAMPVQEPLTTDEVKARAAAARAAIRAGV